MSKIERRRNGWGTKITIGLLIFVGVLLICALITAVLINNETISVESISKFVFGSLAIASLVTNLVLLWNAQNKALPIALLGIGGMLIIISATGMLFFDGITDVRWGNALAVVLGGTSALGRNLIKVNKSKFKNYRSC